jgi:hypothetical protein
MKAPTTTLLLIVTLGLASGGCAAGGLAAVGPLVSALQLIGDRSVERTVPADIATAAAVTVETLAHMGILMKTAERDDASWEARGEGGTVTVRARLTRVTARLTKVVLRVESGRLTADKGTAEEIQNQIAQALTQLAAAGREPSSRAEAGTGAMSALEGEVRRLRLEMEAGRTVTRPPATARPPATDVTPAKSRVREDAVLSIPASYGLPTPAPSAVPVGPELVRPAVTPSAAAFSPSSSAATARPDAVPPTASRPLDRDTILAAPLEPVNVLVPIPPMTGLQRRD